MKWKKTDVEKTYFSYNLETTIISQIMRRSTHKRRTTTTTTYSHPKMEVVQLNYAEICFCFVSLLMNWFSSIGLHGGDPCHVPVPSVWLYFFFLRNVLSIKQMAHDFATPLSFRFGSNEMSNDSICPWRSRCRIDCWLLFTYKIRQGISFAKFFNRIIKMELKRKCDRMGMRWTHQLWHQSSIRYSDRFAKFRSYFWPCVGVGRTQMNRAGKISQWMNASTCSAVECECSDFELGKSTG